MRKNAVAIDAISGGLMALATPECDTGILTGVAADPVAPFVCAASAMGRFVYAGNYGYGTSIVGNAGLGSVSAYTINTTTGALTPVSGSPFAAGYGLNWIAAKSPLAWR